jgi:hypothetical protein
MAHCHQGGDRASAKQEEDVLVPHLLTDEGKPSLRVCKVQHKATGSFFRTLLILERLIHITLFYSSTLQLQISLLKFFCLTHPQGACFTPH